MPSVPTRCGVCGEVFGTKKAKRKHVDREHRIAADDDDNGDIATKGRLPLKIVYDCNA